MYRKNKNNWVKHLDFMILDLICLQVAFFLAYTLRHRTVNLYTNYIYANLSIVLILIDVCLLIFLNTLKNVLKRGYLVEFIATIKHVAIVELVAVLYLFSVKDAGNFSRITFFLMALFYGLLTYGTRLLWKKHILRTLHLKQNKSVLVITNFDRLSQVEKDIRAKRYVMFQISGVAVTGNMPEDHPTEIAGIPLVAAGDYVVEYLCREWVDEVFVNLPLQSAQLDDLVRQLNEMGITVHIQLADKLMFGTQRQFVERLGGYTVLTTSINTISTGELFVKRLFDIIGGLVGCVLTGILFLFLAPAIKIQSPGPVFFSQIRVGKNGKKFKLYKFRSMYTDAEERKAQLAAENRVTDGLMFKLDFDPRIIGCRQLPDGTVKKACTIASIGTTSFFPSKPLACYGDGGAMFTSDARLAERLRMIANHGQKVKYHHALVGCNSRLDTLQAAVLDVKLRYLDEFAAARCKVAARYDAAFSGLDAVRKPLKSAFSSHVYHQYTVQLAVEKRDQVQAALKERGIPSMIYYPLPLQEQEVMRGRCRISGDLNVASRLSRSVLSLPIHTEMTEEEQAYIIESIKSVL